MQFCTCGKLLSPADFGYVCICGRKYDFNMKPLEEDEKEKLQKEADKVKARKGYRFKYPNMGDGTAERKTVTVKESDYYKDME